MAPATEPDTTYEAEDTTEVANTKENSVNDTTLPCSVLCTFALCFISMVQVITSIL